MKKLSVLCPDNVLKISVASYMWFLFRILYQMDVSAYLLWCGGEETYLLALKATSGTFSKKAIH